MQGTPNIGQIVAYLEQLAPPALAEDWDNVGLLVGDSEWPAERVMTCLTITPNTVAEAIERQAQLIVSHHPLPFHPLRSITTETTVGQLLLNLITARIGVYSAHTAFDSAQAGINQHLAIGLGLQEIAPLIPFSGDVNSELGTGRFGELGEEVPLVEMAHRLKSFLGIDAVQVVGTNDQAVSRVAIACGSGGAFLAHAIEKNCNALITGETNHHTCLEAEARRVGLIMPGHFASERFALFSLADYLCDQISGVTVWASASEQDPLRIV